MHPRCPTWLHFKRLKCHLVATCISYGLIFSIVMLPHNTPYKFTWSHVLTHIHTSNNQEKSHVSDVVSNRDLSLHSHTWHSYRHVYILYNWLRLTRHLVHRSYDGHIIPYWKSQRCKHDSNISQRESSQACKKSRKVFCPNRWYSSLLQLPYFHASTQHTIQTYTHTPSHDSDNHIVMYKTLLRALCLHAHTHYTHVISLDLRHLRRYSPWRQLLHMQARKI